jgi:hypothetical protein
MGTNNYYSFVNQLGLKSTLIDKNVALDAPIRKTYTRKRNNNIILAICKTSVKIVLIIYKNHHVRMVAKTSKSLIYNAISIMGTTVSKWIYKGYRYFAG